jgi:hypothetical protein
VTAVLGGNLAVQTLSLAVAVRTVVLVGGAGPAPAILIHVVLGGFFAFFLIRAKRASRQAGVAPQESR